MSDSTADNKICLVLGANGFIGSHFVDRLAVDGYHVKAFDRYTRPPQFGEKSNIEIIKGDLFDEQTLSDALSGVDFVVHSFSATTPFSADADPYSDIDLNLKHNVQIFEQCIANNVRKIFFISSGGAVYGSQAEKQTVSEDDEPLPVSPYGICKLATEHYLHFYKRKYGLEYAIFRLTNPYGPRQVIKQNQGIIAVCIDKIEKGDKVTIFGDGTMSRDYIFIKDAVDMMTRVIEQGNRHAVYNIGSGKQTTLNDILGSFRKVVSRDFEVEYRDAPVTFLQKTQVSTERFIQEFGETTLTDFDSGLHETLSHNKPELLK